MGHPVELDSQVNTFSIELAPVPEPQPRRPQLPGAVDQVDEHLGAPDPLDEGDLLFVSPHRPVEDVLARLPHGPLQALGLQPQTGRERGPCLRTGGGVNSIGKIWA